MTRRDVIAATSLLAATTMSGSAATAVVDSAGGGAATPMVLPEPVCLPDFEALAQGKMSKLAWEYVSSAAADEITYRWNLEAWRKLKLRQHILTDVSHIDTRVTLFGHEHAAPILLAPTAYHKLSHPEGELATARGASAADATMVLSTFSTTAVEEVAAVAKRPLWFQLYVQTDHGFTEHLVRRAEAAGAQALCVTVDTPVLGTRNREQRMHFALPEGMNIPHMAGFSQSGAPAHRPTGLNIYSELLDAALTWKDVEWLRGFAKIPVLLKGVMNADDAERAVQARVAGIIVSNHGGRNLDTSPATLDALPAVTERVAGRIPVLVDGGIRRGTDVLKALALGASAVLIGRPYVYALAVGGADGVQSCVQILQRELRMAMAQTGRTKISEVDKGVLWG